METIKRNFGEQPISLLMRQERVCARDLVAASPEQITYKMVNRAQKGRRLTLNVQNKILKALKKVTGKGYSLADLFNYS
jgi:hypothetical protein